MHRALRTASLLTILLWTAPLAGQEGADLGSAEAMQLRMPLEILATQMPRFQLGALDGIGPPSLALAVQAERLLSIPEGEMGVHGLWSSISLDPAHRAAAKPRWEIDPPGGDVGGTVLGRPPWISGAHFDASVFADALLVEGLAGTASVEAGGDTDEPVRVRRGLFGGYFGAAIRGERGGRVEAGFLRSVWLRSVLSPGANVDEVALIHGEFVDRGGTARRYYGAFLDNGTGSATVAEGYGLYMTPVPGKVRYGVYQAGRETNVFHGPVEIRSDLRVTGKIVSGSELAGGAVCDQAAIYREVTTPSRLSAPGPHTVVALRVGDAGGLLELADAAPGSSIEIARVDACPAAAARVRWAGGSARVGCGRSLRLLFAAEAWRPMR